MSLTLICCCIYSLSAGPACSFVFPLWMNKICLLELKNRTFLTAVGHLEQVVFPKLLEHAAFDLDELRLGAEEREYSMTRGEFTGRSLLLNWQSLD